MYGFTVFHLIGDSFSLYLLSAKTNILLFSFACQFVTVLLTRGIFVLISNSVAEIDGLEKLLVHFAISMWNQIETSGVFSCDFNGRVSARMNFIPFVFEVDLVYLLLML